jgi:lysozyme
MSYQLRELLKRHEGVKTHAYKDHLGYVTVGVGRCLEEDVGLGLSDDEVDYLLTNDIGRCRKELTSEYSWFGGEDNIRQEALINLSFNIGQTRLRGFVKALGHMENGDYESAGDEFYDSKWASQVGDRAFEICQMIRSGEYQER